MSAEEGYFLNVAFLLNYLQKNSLNMHQFLWPFSNKSEYSTDYDNLF